jgi:hypothetical protein
LASSWWVAKIRRAFRYARARVSPDERAALAAWLAEPQLRLFDSMHLADRRHGLDVVGDLRRRGVEDADLLMAGLLHDCGKGPRIRLVHRVAWSLGQRYGAWVWSVASRLPTFRRGLARLRDHAARSGELAEAAGCTPRTVELIRNQESPIDDAGRLLLEADEAN